MQYSYSSIEFLLCRHFFICVEHQAIYLNLWLIFVLISLFFPVKFKRGLTFLMKTFLENKTESFMQININFTEILFNGKCFTQIITVK